MYTLEVEVCEFVNSNEGWATIQPQGQMHGPAASNLGEDGFHAMGDGDGMSKSANTNANAKNQKETKKDPSLIIIKLNSEGKRKKKGSSAEQCPCRPL